jgi:NACHT domain
VQQVRDSLNPEVATFEVFEKAKDELLKDSGLWILDEELFSAWMDGKIPLLFIYGSPGAGKSFLSCRIIQILGQVHPQGVQGAPRASVAYFFCKNNASGLRSHRSILLTIAYQIAKNDPTYAKHVSRLQLFIQDCRSVTSLWQTLFIEFFTRKECRSSALMVLDGLDEADEEERPRFLKLVSALYPSENKTHSKLQVILVGRPEIIEELDAALGFLPPKIEINPAKNSNDIRRYIENTVIQSKLIRRRPKALRDEIIEKLSAGANGFFLWASLMLQEIEKASRLDVIRKTLNNLPKGLTEALRQVVTRYSETMEAEEIDDLNVRSPACQS